MTHIEKAFELIESVAKDCEAQSDSLRATNDVSWSCYDAGNWESMTESLEAAVALIKEVSCINKGVTNEQ